MFEGKKLISACFLVQGLIRFPKRETIKFWRFPEISGFDFKFIFFEVHRRKFEFSWSRTQIHPWTFGPEISEASIREVRFKTLPEKVFFPKKKIVKSQKIFQIRVVRSWEWVRWKPETLAHRMTCQPSLYDAYRQIWVDLNIQKSAKIVEISTLRTLPSKLALPHWLRFQQKKKFENFQPMCK